MKGIPQVKTPSLEVRECNQSPRKNKGSYSGSDISDTPSQRIAPPYKDPPAPPPYRDPPPPASFVKKNTQLASKIPFLSFVFKLMLNIF